MSLSGPLYSFSPAFCFLLDLKLPHHNVASRSLHLVIVSHPFRFFLSYPAVCSVFLSVTRECLYVSAIDTPMGCSSLAALYFRYIFIILAPLGFYFNVKFLIYAPLKFSNFRTLLFCTVPAGTSCASLFRNGIR